MTDTTGPTVEAMNGASPPRLSDEGIAYQRDLLNDPTFSRDHPQHAAMLKATLEEALKATGQDQAPQADQRTPAQRLHDQQHGVSFAPSGAVVLPDHLTTSMQRDATEQAPPDPEAVAQHLERAGHDPKAVLADAKYALERAGSKVPVERLGAHALAQLALYGSHIKKHQATRPQ
jgi:hypothetical protein